MSSRRHAWVDATAGVAGDMLVGALIDAGADPAGIQRAVDAVIPDSVVLRYEVVTRAGMRAGKADFEPLVASPPARHWSTIRDLITGADLAERTRRRALDTFLRLAEAEAYVHGVDLEQVHFHEVGALDSIADIVGVCAGLELLGVTTLSAGPVALGSGRMRTQHGDLGVPGPAVARLAQGWRVRSGGEGELATPTGMALLVALSERCEDLPGLALTQVGSGAGTRDTPGRANVTRVLIGDAETGGARSAVRGPGEPTAAGITEPVVVLEANVDDFDPRLWPGVISALLAAGAADAWLVPILMKKGRPAHTLCVLALPDRARALQELILASTSTLGVREARLDRLILERGWVEVVVHDLTVPVKVAHRDARIWQVMPEFDETEAAAARLDLPVRAVLADVVDAARTAGLRPGRPVPDGLRSDRARLNH